MAGGRPASDFSRTVLELRNAGAALDGRCQPYQSSPNECGDLLARRSPRCSNTPGIRPAHRSLKANLLDLIQNALLPAAMLLAGAAPACGQMRAAIYVMKVDGGEVRKVSHNDERWLGSPAWSHDAKRLLYDAAPPNRNYRQCRIM